jgi:parallel beta-helix repeat protein
VIRLSHRFGLGVVAVAVAALFPASAAAGTINVFPGEKIQAAVNAANPGDTIVVHPGTYRESVEIHKNGLNLRGSGASDSGTVVKPAKHSTNCDHGGGGICIEGKEGNLVAGTHVNGFLVDGFKEFGVIGEHVRRTIIKHNRFVDNGEYGAATFNSRKTRMLRNRSSDAGEAGFYVGDSPHAHAIVRGNVAHANATFGLFLRDSKNGIVINNRADHNCMGIAVLNTGAPGGAQLWTVKGNKVVRNNRFCPPEEGGPPVSGTGIGLIGARNSVVRGNVVSHNRPAHSGAPFAGGIALFSSAAFGGSAAANDTITRNRAHRNKPDDLVWDGSGKHNRFNHNKCGTSQPPGLC